MTTPLDIINGAARLIGVVFKSESLSDDEAADGLVALNDMLDTWSNDNLITYAYTLETFSLTGAASYTIGSGGDFNTTRPINIVDAVVRYGSIDYPLTIISQEQYQEEIALKSTTSPVPKYLTYDNAYPLATIKMYYVPSAGSTLYLQTNKPLGNFASLTTTIALPPGWKRALKYNLAVDIAAEYGVEVPATVLRTANTSLGAIKRATSINNPMQPLGRNTRDGNIFSGWYS